MSTEQRETQHQNELYNRLATLTARAAKLEEEVQRLHEENKRQRDALQLSALHLSDYAEALDAEAKPAVIGVRKAIERITASGSIRWAGQITEDMEKAWEAATHLGSPDEVRS